MGVLLEVRHLLALVVVEQVGGIVEGQVSLLVRISGPADEHVFGAVLLLVGLLGQGKAVPGLDLGVIDAAVGVVVPDLEALGGSPSVDLEGLSVLLVDPLKGEAGAYGHVSAGGGIEGGPGVVPHRCPVVVAAAADPEFSGLARRIEDDLLAVPVIDVLVGAYIDVFSGAEALDGRVLSLLFILLLGLADDVGGDALSPDHGLILVLEVGEGLLGILVGVETVLVYDVLWEYRVAGIHGAVLVQDLHRRVFGVLLVYSALRIAPSVALHQRGREDAGNALAVPVDDDDLIALVDVLDGGDLIIAVEVRTVGAGIVSGHVVGVNGKDRRVLLAVRDDHPELSAVLGDAQPRGLPVPQD